MFIIDNIMFCVIAYFLGSLSSAIITCKLMGLPDPRSEGSGNPGTTNVLRIGGRKAAAVTLLGDVLKGAIPVLLSKAAGLGGMGIAFIALFAVLGHLLPIFFKFQGGKGVATLLGGLAALNWMLALAFIATWLLVAVISRYSSLSSIIGVILVPIYAYLIAPYFTIPLAIISIAILLRHKDNIKRLLSGDESKIGKKNSN